MDLLLAAPLTTGAELKNWILTVAGNVFVAFLALRATGHFIKKDWGEMVTMAVAAVFVAGIIWFPDEVRSLLSGVWNKVSGSG